MIKRVLFVDDNEMVINTYKHVFENRDNWQCFFAHDAVEATEYLSFSSIDIIITDLNMPIYNGAKLLEFVQKKHPLITRIVFTGSVVDNSSLSIVNLAHRYIQKPTSIKDLEQIIEDIYELYNKIIDKKIKYKLSSITNLPTLPTVYFDIIEEFNSPNFSIDVISNLISSDVGMSTEILKMINSPFFGISDRVTSIKQAVTLLGSEITKGLILTAHISRAFSSDEEKFPISTWEDHSYLVAIFAQTIGEYEGLSKKDCDNLYIGGLLHDIGRLILATKFSEEYKDVISIANVSQKALYEIEKDTVGISHTIIGAYLIGLWGIPSEIVDIVAFHHDPSAYGGINQQIIDIVSMADILTFEIIPAFSEDVESKHYSKFQYTQDKKTADKWKKVCIEKAKNMGIIIKSN